MEAKHICILFLYISPSMKIFYIQIIYLFVTLFRMSFLQKMGTFRVISHPQLPIQLCINEIYQCYTFHLLIKLPYNQYMLVCHSNKLQWSHLTIDLNMFIPMASLNLTYLILTKQKKATFMS